MDKHWVLKVALLILLNVPGAVSNTMLLPTAEVNSVLDIFKACENDIIFVGEAENVQPKFPVAIYSLLNYSVYFPIFHKYNYSNQEDGCVLDSLIEATDGIKFRCINYNPFLLKTSINFKFNCLGILILGAQSAADVRKAVLSYRNTWVHYTTYINKVEKESKLILNKKRMNDVDEDAIMYSQNLYINVLFYETPKFISSPIWKPWKFFSHSYRDRIPILYLWKLFNGIDSNRFQLSLSFSSPCEFKVQIDNVFPNFGLNILRNLMRSAFKLDCQIYYWNVYIFAMEQSPVSGYYGPPIKVSPKEYLKGDTWKRLTHEIILLSTILEVLPNTTINAMREDKKDESMVGLKNNWKHRDLIYLDINPFSRFSKLIRTDSYWYPIETRGFSFMACNERSTYISFSAYSSPFDFHNWVSIGATVCISSLFLAIVFFLKKIEENGIILLYSFLLEHGYHLSRKLQEVRAFNIFLTIFLLTGIVLTNGYKGVVITDLTAPAPETRLTTFKEAMEQNYSILLVVTDELITSINLTAAEFQKYLFPPGTLTITKDNVEYTFEDVYLKCALTIMCETNFIQNIVEILKSPSINNSSPKGQLYENVLIKFVPWKERVFNLVANGTAAEFLKCNKTILVDTAYNLMPLYLKWKSETNAQKYSIYMVNDEIGENRVGLHMESSQWDVGVMTGRMSSMFSSGIYSRWQDLRRLKYLTANENLEKRRDLSNHPKKLALSTNILTIFVIYFALFPITLVIFICENHKSIVKQYKSLRQKLFLIKIFKKS